GQQRHRLGNGRFHVHGGAIDIAVEAELQGDVGGSLAAVGNHRVQAGDGRELPLQRRRHGGSHSVRIGAGQAGRYIDRRVVHLRKIAHRQGLVGNDAEQGGSSHDQAGGDGPTNEIFRDVHGEPSLATAGQVSRPAFRVPRLSWHRVL